MEKIQKEGKWTSNESAVHNHSQEFSVEMKMNLL